MKELMYIRSFSKRHLSVIMGTLLLVIIGSVWLNTATFRSGFEITDENIEDSRWLLENEIPLTAENLESYQSLKDLRLPQDNEVVLKAITDAIAQGKRPKDAVLAITRQRQLEEVRLEMSAKANYALAGKGIRSRVDPVC